MFRSLLPKQPIPANSTNWISVRRNSNAAILDMLRRSREAEKNSTKNPYRMKAFKNAIIAIEGMKTSIDSAEDVAKVPDIGKRIRERIKHFLETGDPDVERIFGSSRDQSQQRIRAELMQVPYMGPTVATRLIKAGCTSVQDVITRPHLLEMLLPKQRAGITFHRQLQQPVTLAEAETVRNFIKESVSPEYRILLCGGHRRSPHDTTLDTAMILLTHPSEVQVVIPDDVGPRDPAIISRGRAQYPFRPNDGYTSKDQKLTSPLIMQIVPRLHDRGLIAETISQHMCKWTGVVRVPQSDDGGLDNIAFIRSNRKDAISQARGRYITLEINLAPQKSLGTASMALTGDLEFNRTVQKRASKMGMLLTEYGLWKWIPVPPGNSTDENAPQGTWRLLPSDSEEAIFAELGMEYVPPEKRNYGHLVGRYYKR